MAKNSISELGGEIPYDLRQVYAVDIVGSHLKDIARARKTDDYSNYFKSLKDLWIIVKHKIKDKKIKVIGEDKKEKDITTEKYYGLLLNKAIEIINKNPQDFLGNSKTPEGCAAIEEVLNVIEMLLYEKMEEAKMFGSSRAIPGL